MISVAEVVNDSDFAQPFAILRSSNGFFDSNGRWNDAKIQIPMYGIVKPATAKELEQVPEGDRVKEVKSFHSAQEMRITHTDGVTDASQGTSDIAVSITTGEQYKLVKLYPWQDFGYFKALGVRIGGQ